MDHLKFLDKDIVEEYAELLLRILHGRLFVPSLFGARFAIRHITELYNAYKAKTSMIVPTSTSVISDTEEDIIDAIQYNLDVSDNKLYSLIKSCLSSVVYFSYLFQVMTNFFSLNCFSNS